MKKLFLSMGLLVAISGIASAQTKVAPKPTVTEVAQGTVAAAAKPASSLTIDNMYFKLPVHEFGNLQEGPAAEHEFVFTNTGKEPIVISNVSASCGCTTPSYSKEPVLPGKTGVIKASYNTQGRVGPFTKSITITSNAGTKVLTIKGEVEKAPTGSVPENNSMIKTN